MKKLLLLYLAMTISSLVVSQNPLVTHIYTADPTARVFDGQLYLYPSHDVVPPADLKNPPRFCMPDYHIFSLENGNTWRDHGVVLDQNEVPWGAKNSYGMWAPDCIKKGNKYYYYYPASPEDGSAFRRIGVGLSNSPTGPFKWEKNYIDGVSGIDPGLLLDDDDHAYLFFGGGHELYVAPLAENMKAITQKPLLIEGLPAGYKEGSFPFKKDSVYYLTFAHVFADEGYTIGYATSDSPMGPYTYQGKIMDNIDNGTNHHSVVKYKDRWILFYHWWDISGQNKLRSMRADYMEFKPDGTIRKVTPTLRGINTPTLGDTIQIDRYSEIKGAETAFVGGNEPKGWMVCETHMMSYVGFNRVNFGSGEAQKIHARVSCGQRIGSYEVRIDSPKGPLVATFNAQYTGGWNKWITQEAPVENKIEGIHDLYVVFKADWGSTKVVNLNWLVIE
ncbi:family 43 glycosylhydrolase [Reichenbachiella agarivorans]|uniref:Family 43 glycosylhydrolase n=1 Tax=Reichenbachiella agarivorans TaxID=2979464 RepID=A0ABY6CNA3_9BACT|nr:family 43 glycosylhydrolase [Reichenbachiella agarivorans]UXP31998.1 family 43 glycosylhydrolase [Reichenbachiella agarivorans]